MEPFGCTQRMLLRLMPEYQRREKRGEQTARYSSLVDVGFGEGVGGGGALAEGFAGGLHGLAGEGSGDGGVHHQFGEAAGGPFEWVRWRGGGAGVAHRREALFLF